LTCEETKRIAKPRLYYELEDIQKMFRNISRTMYNIIKKAKNDLYEIFYQTNSKKPLVTCTGTYNIHRPI
jgi:hypothetical protein